MKGISIIIILIVLLSCQVGPKEIVYGEQACHSCKMTIVDKQHAAQLVTSKGKIYNFDAIECMIPFYLQEEEMEFTYLMVNDYINPSDLMDAKNSIFLISNDIPSPMGANLSAIYSKEQAQQLLEKNQGMIYNWSELLDYFKKL